MGELIDQCKFTDVHSVNIHCPLHESVISQHEDSNNQTTASCHMHHTNNRCNTFPTILKMIQGAVSSEDYQHNPTGKKNKKSSRPTMRSTLQKFKDIHNITLDDKQLKAFTIICCTFLLTIIQDQIPPNMMSKQKYKDIITKIKTLGGKDQLVMFLTGPAGAGKTTAIKVAQSFCRDFCEKAGISFDEHSFFFTAYTGSAASMFGGKTTLKSMQIPISGQLGDISEKTLSTLRDVKVLICDEISFMTNDQLQNINRRLQEVFECTKQYGGLSIIFTGDFRQLHPKCDHNQLLYASKNRNFEIALNAALVLDNKHRFKDDEAFGDMLKEMWFDDLSRQHKQAINKRVVRKGQLNMPDLLDQDSHYACPTNIERNAIHAQNFKRHILQTHR